MKWIGILVILTASAALAHNHDHGGQGHGHEHEVLGPPADVIEGVMGGLGAPVPTLPAPRPGAVAGTPCGSPAPVAVPPPAGPIPDGQTWIAGSPDCSTHTDPMMQVVQLDTDTYVLRQSPCAHREAPFLYLFFGDDKAYLQDTGATSDARTNPVAGIVQRLIAERAARTGRPPVKLMVGHSHGHGDHVAGDGLFAGMPNTTVIGTTAAAQASAFGITRWPNEVGRMDLGGRVLSAIPIPGHEPSSIAVYDERTRALLTGDTLYPGRLYIDDWPSYRRSIARLDDFTRTHPVGQVLGCHIEMSATPGQDYPYSAQHHPNEHGLVLNAGHVHELRTAVDAMGDNPRREVHGDFIISP